MVGASGDKTKFSYEVLRVLHETGYEMLPVNPNPDLTEIRGIPVNHSLEEIDRPVDMVDVFRRKKSSMALPRRRSQSGQRCSGAKLTYMMTVSQSWRRILD